MTVCKPNRTVALSRGRRADPGLDATLRSVATGLLRSSGWRGLTIERVALRAGVARTTVYRRHGSVHGLLLMMLANAERPAPPPDSGSLRGDLLPYVRALAVTLRDPAQADLWVALTAARVESTEVAAAYRQASDNRRDAVANVLRRASDRGELSADADLSVLADVVIAAVLLPALEGRPISERSADAIVERVLGGSTTIA